MIAATASRPSSLEPGKSLYGLYIVSLTAVLVGNLLVRIGERGGWLPETGQVALAVISAAPLAVAAGLFWRLLRSDLDELMQRVVLEGMAFALIIYLPLAAVYVNLRTAGVGVPRLDPPDILLTPALLVALGIGLAWRRYR
ncbi:MAG TPA: hypothetical protein VK922_14350 [Gemmatimonadaceae bacterium]|nr:hypothetical protein [Gemmatimonadaceae bacterium]